MNAKLKCFLLGVLITSIAYTQDLPPDLQAFKKDLTSYITKRMKKRKVTGMSIALLIDNHLVLNEGFGFTDLQKGISVNKESIFPIGSVSKIVTATAILKLYSDGLIDIDKPYIDYVPEFSMKKQFEEDQAFTIRHLLAHYAGLPRLRAKDFLQKIDEPLDRILAYSKEEFLIAPPGYVYQYSDWGVDLLALLVKRVSGQDFEQYVEKNIFQALQMNHSYFGPVAEGKGYVNHKERATYLYSYAGSDGVASTAADLLKLTQLYLNDGQVDGKELIKSTIIEEAFQKQFSDATLAYDRNIGLMWDITDLKAGKRIRKAGIHEPYYTYIFSIPKYNTAMIVCSNSNSSSLMHRGCWNKVFKFLSKKFGFPNSQQAIKKGKAYKKVKPSEDEWAKLEGHYSTASGILNLKRKGNKLKVILRTNEETKGIGIPYSDGLVKLYVKLLGIRIHALDVFIEEVDGKIIIGQQYKSGNRSVFGAKINLKTIPESWKAAVGTYEVINYDENDYETIESFQLLINAAGFLEISGKIKFPDKTSFQLALSPISSEMAIVPGYNFDFFGGETIRLEQKGNSFEIIFSGYRLKKIE